MNILAAASTLLFVAVFAASISAQDKRTPLDDYIDDAETIVSCRAAA